MTLVAYLMEGEGRACDRQEDTTARGVRGLAR